MKKQQQTNINLLCENAIDEFNNHFQHGCVNYDHKRLRSCNAYVMQDSRYIWLQSYKTIVAFYDKQNSIFYDVLRFVYRYTSTSAQHIAKFRNEIGYKNIAKELRYYNV